LFKTDNHVNEFLSINSLFGILPVIHTATRITINSATLIDNIFTNVIDSNAHCGTFCTDITDHLPIFMILKGHNLSCNESNEYFMRNFSQDQIQNFQNDLIKENWSYVYSCHNSEEAYNLFIRRFTILFDRHFPLVKKKCNKRIRKPWINKFILRAINMKNNLYKKFINKKNAANERKYKKQRNKVNNMLQNAKKKYVCYKLNQFKYDAKKTWTVINSLLNKPKHSLS